MDNPLLKKPLTFDHSSLCDWGIGMPDFQDYAVEALKPGIVGAETRRLMGTFLRVVVKCTMGGRNFLVFRP
ncbi:MAG: hypothetical protein NPIRA03_26620 [Nitrospirales bacterium]|nr:MAG: hypothetical protein NPIRA03_26620 [Nitrospirales bacterium]